MALLDHVGLKVTDLERAIEFYTEQQTVYMDRPQ